ncbi:type IV pilus assembly protein PilM [Haloimpatiens massiliensis]|uniref:type IV pilus assembly protein PilM n=1 Tax=Haloimpatiens massiliensis TaxID=1658110 RepID=UPI001A9A3ED7|nr:type IV pilus assembly protein PilM [Haloimpatiens massiliensis]
MFKNDILSIDIGAKNIKILDLKVNKKNISVNNAFSIKTPENSYNDGEINDIGKIKAVLEKNLELKNIKTKKAVFTSKSTSIITREILVPAADEKDMEALIKFQIERYLPIMSEDYIIQHKIMDTFIENDVEKSRVNVVAYPKSIAQGYLALCKELKFTPLALDINSNSICKLFYATCNINGEEYEKEKSIAFIDIGSEYSEISILKNYNVEFSRIISIGSSYIDVDISKNLFISEEEGEEKKLNLLNLNEEIDKGSLKEVLNDFGKIWTSNLVVEIDKIIQYYRKKNSGDTIEEIFIYGGGSRLKGLAKYMSKSLGISVNSINNMPNFNMDKHQENIMDYINAAGAAIRL